MNTCLGSKKSTTFFRLMYLGLHLEKLKAKSFFLLTSGCGRSSQTLLAAASHSARNLPLPPLDAVLTLVYPALGPRRLNCMDIISRLSCPLSSIWSLISHLTPLKTGSGWLNHGIRGHSSSPGSLLGTAFSSFWVPITSLFPLVLGWYSPSTLFLVVCAHSAHAFIHHPFIKDKSP